MDRLELVKPTPEYKEAALDYINEFLQYNSNINGVVGLNRYLDNYEGWLVKIEEDKNRIPNEEKVPALTYFLTRKSDNRIVGMINIRLILNERLRMGSGHIGYSIRPTERRKGYNKINLYLGLKVCQEHGIKEVLMACDKENIASAKTMLALGAKLDHEDYIDSPNGNLVQHYTIDVDRSISQYQKTINK